MNPISDTLATTTTVATLHARAEHILLAGLALGVAGDFLLREGPFGIGLFIWLALAAASALWLLRAAGQQRLRSIATWSATALCAALITMLRDLEGLIPGMLFVILGCAVLTSVETSGLALRAARVRDYLLTGFSFPLQVLTVAPRILKQADVTPVTQNRRVPGIVRGIVLALPVLLVFGVLFASADAGFSQYLGAVSDIVSEETLQHLLLVLVFGWLGTSLLGVACRKPAAVADTAQPNQPLNVGATETHVVLALVSALFIAFVLLQLGYLFGGSAVIESTSGLTVAEHARRGFFELLVVAALTLGLLLALSVTDCERHVLRRYGTVLIVCVLVILASALQRLFLYTDAFGLTLDRVTALAAMLFLVINLLSFGATVLRGDIGGFASGIAISAISCLLLLGVVNPAAVVTRVNLDRHFERGAVLDIGYLLGMGADPIPQVLARFDALDASTQCSVAMHIADRYPDTLGSAPAANEDWRRWNAARVAARNAIAEHLPQIAPMATAYTRNRAQLAEDLRVGRAPVGGISPGC